MCEKNFWVRIRNVEAQCESVNERVETHGEKNFVSSETVESLIRDEVAEIKRIDRKQLNLIRLYMSETKQETSTGRQLEDKDFLTKLMETKMNLDTAEIKVFKFIRLGKRAVSDVGYVKCRPLRLSV